jgi:hypothetical protein
MQLHECRPDLLLAREATNATPGCEERPSFSGLAFIIVRRLSPASSRGDAKGNPEKVPRTFTSPEEQLKT